MLKHLITYFLLFVVTISYGQRGIVPYDVQRIARVTGKSQSSDTFPNPNKTDEKYNVGGTDLGIAWDMEDGEVGLFFGDTYGSDFKPTHNGGPGDATGWRSNVLAFANGKDLFNGLSFTNMLCNDGEKNAKEVAHSKHQDNCVGDRTMIPTAAIHAGEADYVHCMNVRCWGVPGRWTTNFSTLYQSLDHGKTWNRCSAITFSSTSNFAQAAYAKKEGYVYLMGTKSGRDGTIYLARVKEADMIHQDKYEYWNKDTGWKKGVETLATQIFDTPAGEMSLCYNRKFQRWIIAYLSEKKKGIVLRDAENITGPWTEEKLLVSSKDYSGLYGSFIYPLKNDGNDLYFLMSIWKEYNVFLMKAKLKMALK